MNTISQLTIAPLFHQNFSGFAINPDIIFQIIKGGWKDTSFCHEDYPTFQKDDYILRCHKIEGGLEYILTVLNPDKTRELGVFASRDYKESMLQYELLIKK